MSSPLVAAEWRLFYRHFIRKGSKAFARKIILVGGDENILMKDQIASPVPDKNGDIKIIKTGSNMLFKDYIKLLKLKFTDKSRITELQTSLGIHSKPLNEQLRNQVIQRLNKTLQIVQNAVYTRDVHDQKVSSNSNLLADGSESLARYPHEFILLHNYISVEYNNRRWNVLKSTAGQNRSTHSKPNQALLQPKPTNPLDTNPETSHFPSVSVFANKSIQNQPNVPASQNKEPSNQKPKKTVYADPSQQMYLELLKKLESKVGIWI